MRTNRSTPFDEHELGEDLIEPFLCLCFQPEGSRQSFTQTLFLEFAPKKTSLSREVEFLFPSAAVPGSLSAQVTAVGMLAHKNAHAWHHFTDKIQNSLFAYKIQLPARGGKIGFCFHLFIFLLLAAESKMKQSNRVVSKNCLFFVYRYDQYLSPGHVCHVCIHFQSRLPSCTGCTWVLSRLYLRLRPPSHYKEDHKVPNAS